MTESNAPSADERGELQLWLAHRRVIVLGLVVLASATVFTYLTNYMTTFAQTVLHMGARISFAATILIGVCSVAGSLFGGWLSDRIGRWPVMVWPRILYVIVAWPLYWWIVEARSAAVLLGVTGVLALLGTLSFGPFAAALSESLPRRIRGSGYGTIYSSSIAVFGGTAQIIATWFIHVTGNPLAFTWYLIASGVCGAVAMAMMAETAPAHANFLPRVSSAAFS